MSEAIMRRFALAREPVWGIKALTPSARLLRITGRPDISVGRSWITSDEMRSDRETPLGTSGANSTKISIPAEFSFGSHDDLMEAALFGRWLPNTGAQPVTLAVSLTIAAAAWTYTRASGSFLTDGFAVGDYVIVSGFVNAGNNGVFKITALSATVMTFGDALLASGVTLVNETLATGAIFDRWNGLPVQFGAQTCAVAVGSPATYTRSAGSYVTDGIQVGDYATFSGFTNGGNNGTFKVTAVAALILSVTNPGAVVEGAAAARAYASTHMVLKAGTLRQFFDVEQGQMDFATGKYQTMLGGMIDAWKIDFPSSGKVTQSFDLIGFGGDVPSDTPLTVSPTAQSTTPIFNTCIGSIKEGGLTVAIVTALSFNVSNNGKLDYVLFTRNPGASGFDRRKVTGKISFRATDRTFETKYLNETLTAIVLTPTDVLGNKYVFTFPAVKYTNANDEGDPTDIVLGLPFEAGPDTTLATSVQVEKIPA